MKVLITCLAFFVTGAHAQPAADWQQSVQMGLESDPQTEIPIEPALLVTIQNSTVRLNANLVLPTSQIMRANDCKAEIRDSVVKNLLAGDKIPEDNSLRMIDLPCMLGTLPVRFFHTQKASEIWANTTEARAFMIHLCRVATQKWMLGDCLKDVNSIFSKELPSNFYEVTIQICDGASYKGKSGDDNFWRYSCYRNAVGLLKDQTLLQDTKICRGNNYDWKDGLDRDTKCFSQAFTQRLSPNR